MSAAYCSDCARNVTLEMSESEINDISFDDSDFSLSMEIHILFCCSECGMELGEFTGQSYILVPKLEDYIDSHEEVDISDIEILGEEISETKVVTRYGRKTYLSKWRANVKLIKKIFECKGELAVTQDQIEFYK